MARDAEETGGPRLGDSPSEHHQVVPVDHLIAAAPAEDGFDLVRAAAGDAACAVRVVGGQAACDFPALRI